MFTLHVHVSCQEVEGTVVEIQLRCEGSSTQRWLIETFMIVSVFNSRSGHFQQYFGKEKANIFASPAVMKNIIECFSLDIRTFSTMSVVTNPSVFNKCFIFFFYSFILFNFFLGQLVYNFQTHLWQQNQVF